MSKSKKEILAVFAFRIIKELEQRKCNIDSQIDSLPNGEVKAMWGGSRIAFNDSINIINSELLKAINEKE